MIEIHLYGTLRDLVKGSCASEDTVLCVEYNRGETFEQLVTRLGLVRKDLGDCFINGTLAKSTDVLSDGDRVGLFPFNMRLLCGGQYLKGHGFIESDVDIDHY
jgi:molybdopterin converting factor small subunit